MTVYTFKLSYRNLPDGDPRKGKSSEFHVTYTDKTPTGFKIGTEFSSQTWAESKLPHELIDDFISALEEARSTFAAMQPPPKGS